MIASTSDRKLRARIVAVLFAALTASGLTACAAEYEAPLGECYPSYTPSTRWGSFSAQQAGPGLGIQWGAYPNHSATRYVVDVYVGNRRVDAKDQTYPPHGSVSATDVRPGQIFRLTGTVYDGSDTLVFTLQCRIS